MIKLLIALALTALNAQASNHHEHLDYLPLPEDFQAAAIVVEPSLLRVTTTPEQTTTQRRDAYIAAGTARHRLFKAMDLPVFLKVFESYFSHEPLENRRIIDVTTSVNHFIEPAAAARMAALRALARTHGSEMNFFAGLTRMSLLAGTDDVLGDGRLAAAIARGEVSGIDIVGSIFEGDWSDPINSSRPLAESVALYRAKGWPFRADSSDPVALAYAKNPERPLAAHILGQALMRAFHFTARNGAELRLHAFEGSNHGPFYDGLAMVIGAYDGPPLRLRLGHALHLNTWWIQLLGTNPRLHISVEVNLASNEALMDARAAEILTRNIRELHSAGIMVQLGSDGRGMLTASDVTAERLVLEAHGCGPLLEP